MNQFQAGIARDGAVQNQIVCSVPPHTAVKPETAAAMALPITAAVLIPFGFKGKLYLSAFLLFLL